MSNKNYELRYLDRENLADQGIDVPSVQPYNFLEDALPKIGDKLRNGLNVKANVGSPVFAVTAISDERRDDTLITIIDLKFDHMDPTPFSKVPENS